MPPKIQPRIPGAIGMFNANLSILEKRL
jgi:hypothetical protein